MRSQFGLGWDKEGEGEEEMEGEKETIGNGRLTWLDSSHLVVPISFPIRLDISVLRRLLDLYEKHERISSLLSRLFEAAVSFRSPSLLSFVRTSKRRRQTHLDVVDQAPIRIRSRSQIVRASPGLVDDELETMRTGREVENQREVLGAVRSTKTKKEIDVQLDRLL